MLFTPPPFQHLVGSEVNGYQTSNLNRMQLPKISPIYYMSHTKKSTKKKNQKIKKREREREIEKKEKRESPFREPFSPCEEGPPLGKGHVRSLLARKKRW